MVGSPPLAFDNGLMPSQLDPRFPCIAVPSPARTLVIVVVCRRWAVRLAGVYDRG
uniref:Uncharacterized protein n=1 Tax=uncultured alpha proteobacterium HF0130_06E21 TaxID=710808 RepID=E0XSY7_9PROT|nr:hypothetical protein [uncultured alpha proteobacterium HF0130_06E21]